MTMGWCALLVTAATTVNAVLLHGVQEASKQRPIMKVVRLLQDMQSQLEHELEDDRAVHEKLDCWCKENNADKTKAIETGESQELHLETVLGETAAKMKELKVKRDATLDEVNRDVEALHQAQNLRMKENSAFHGEEVDLIEAIKACDQAITALGKHNPGVAGVSQVQAAAQRLQRAQVFNLVKRRSSGSATVFKLAALKAFLAQAQGSDPSLLAIPGYRSYAPQSGQILGILGQMMEDFKQDLSDSQGGEKLAVANFLAVKKAKDEEIASGRQLVLHLDEDLANLKMKHADATKELDDTQAQLSLDREFLGSLIKKCSETDEEFQTRVKARLQETAAVADTISILNADTAFDNFEKTVSTDFLQIALNSKDEGKQLQRLQDAATVLRKASTQLGSPQLALLANSAQLDAFTKVKAAIDKMVAELAKQQEDEVAHRDWCIDELAQNKRDTAASNDKKDDLQAAIQSTNKVLAGLAKEIKATQAAVVEMQEQMKRASEIREAEAADYHETVTDQRLTQFILQKAIARMSDVYAFLQEAPAPGAAHVHTSGNHTDAGNGPARFTSYGKHTGGSKVITLLETIMGDSRQMEQDAIAAEQDAQTAYENFMKGSNKAITAYTRKVTNMKGSAARAKEELILSKTDLSATMKDLEELAGKLGDLRGACDFVMNNFDARQEARAAEMSALKEAKAVLSGAK